MDDSQPDDLRIRALWCLEGLDNVEPTQLEKLSGASHRALRKEALRVARGAVVQASRLPVRLQLEMARRGLADTDRLVRQDKEALRAARLEKILGAIQNNLEQIPELKDRLRRLVDGWK